MRSAHIVLSACAGIGALASVASAHFDVYVDTDGSRITTSGVDVDTASISPGVRVFGADLGEFPIPPGFGDEPGFFSSSFVPNASVAFDIVDGLRIWNGVDFSSLATQSLELSKGISTATAPSTDSGFAAGFTFATADGAGDLHEHLDLELTPNTDVGVFLLSLRLRTDAPGIDPSETLWIVLNNGDDESAHDAAVEWAEANLVPAPSIGALVALGLVASARRRAR